MFDINNNNNNIYSIGDNIYINDDEKSSSIINPNILSIGSSSSSCNVDHNTITSNNKYIIGDNISFKSDDEKDSIFYTNILDIGSLSIDMNNNEMINNEMLSNFDYDSSTLHTIDTDNTVIDTSTTTINTKCILLRVLVVDDASSNRKLLCRLLKEKYATDEAEDGLIALNKVLESMKSNINIFNVVLMDYQMPNMDGPTSVKHMRDAGYDGLIIGITGNALEKDLLYFKNQGVNEVLTKPVNIPQLKHILLSSDIYINKL